MNRRNMILCGAAAPLLLATVPRFARAQQTTSGSQEPIGAAKYKRMTLQLGTLSKETSELAMKQAINPRVKQFAGFEIAEQTTIAQVLTDSQNPPPAPLDTTLSAQLQQLQSATGAAFDPQYLKAQIQVHNELLNVQEEFLRAQPAMNTDNVHVAMLARTVIQMHLTMLADLVNITHG